jgi:hypothetical protein
MDRIRASQPKDNLKKAVSHEEFISATLHDDRGTG